MGAGLRLSWRLWGLERRVHRHGWTGVYVSDYLSAPTWAYSIGFDGTLNQPEVLVFDLPREIAAGAISQAFQELRSEALILEDGAHWPPDGGARSVWRKVHPSWIDDGWLTLAVARRWKQTGNRKGLEAFQLVLSDGERRLPWEDGYDERLRDRQPSLWLPKA